ncbi:NADH-quinone oxidoreductase subunit NuoE [Microvirga arsenatis]|uniref:NADH-quinone oxidoreductase subunit NuoE n=1 Tax=Microvirga arsenatis TaxID=2692265 RepID=A0ABW9YWR1_9HYPH|nr:NADH-quinone oxidoreductase subunit NuoE [Microvirga arsenatis]NBJ12425.1 NADH-quinone oxidoreductase subunit NuoE [Microvirga arsenatis]NBJ23301.1 NADH-quinone oxidoreductase subunit NuoE [Microvirga arsenatis]
MAVRKLAPEELQPQSFVLSPETEAFADKEIAKYPPGRQASAVIALLGKAQEQAGGWLPRKAIEAVAAKLDMPVIRVMEVATFYTMFNLEPVGKYFIQFCGTTPCVLRGAGDIKKVLERRIGDQNHITPDGLFSWLEVECLGACSNAPMVQINDDYYEDLTTENFEKLLDDLAAGRPVKKGSQIGRNRSEPFEAVNTLQDPALYDGSLVGAWRKRFDEQAKVAETGETAAAMASVPQEARAAKPGAGRAIESEAADTPAKRAKEGETPINPVDRKEAADPSTATKGPSHTEAEPRPAPQSSKSYVASPTKDGEAVPSSPTTPVAGTPPAQAETRRDGSESKPGVVVDKDNKTS